MKDLIRREQILLKQIQNLKSELEARDNFKPYIYIETSLKRPTFITAAAFFGGSMKYINEIPEEIHDLSKSEQVNIIKNIILKHYHDNDGKCPLFGDITGYTFYRSYNEGIKFSLSGDIITDKVTHKSKPETGIYYENRKIFTGTETI